MIESPRPSNAEAIGPYRWVKPQVRDKVNEELVQGHDYKFVATEIFDFYIEEAFGTAQHLSDQVIEKITDLEIIQRNLVIVRGIKNTLMRTALKRSVARLSDEITALDIEAEHATVKARLIDESRDLKYVFHRASGEDLTGTIKGHDLVINAYRVVLGMLDGEDLSGQDARAIFIKYADIVNERQQVVGKRFEDIDHFHGYLTQAALEAKRNAPPTNLKEKVAEILK